MVKVECYVLKLNQNIKTECAIALCRTCVHVIQLKVDIPPADVTSSFKSRSKEIFVVETYSVGLDKKFLTYLHVDLFTYQ